MEICTRIIFICRPLFYWDIVYYIISRRYLFKGCDSLTPWYAVTIYGSGARVSISSLEPGSCFVSGKFSSSISTKAIVVLNTSLLFMMYLMGYYLGALSSSHENIFWKSRYNLSQRMSCAIPSQLWSLRYLFLPKCSCPCSRQKLKLILQSFHRASCYAICPDVNASLKRSSHCLGSDNHIKRRTGDHYEVQGCTWAVEGKRDGFHYFQSFRSTTIAHRDFPMVDSTIRPSFFIEPRDNR